MVAFWWLVIHILLHWIGQPSYAIPQSSITAQPALPLVKRWVRKIHPGTAYMLEKRGTFWWITSTHFMLDAQTPGLQQCFSACINTAKEWGQHVWGASIEALVYILNWNAILSLFFNEPVISRFLALPTWNHIQHISWYLEDFVTSMIRCVWYESIQNAWDVMRKLDFIASSSWCDATQPVWCTYRSLRPLLIFHSGVGHSKPHGRNISTFRLFLFF